MVDVVPIDLKWYEGYEKVYFETFSQALDEYFGKLTIEKAKAEKQKARRKRKQLLATLKRQEEMIKGFEKELKKNQEIGNLIYANYTLIDGLLREFSKAVKNLGWDEFKKRIEEGKKKGNKIALMVKGIEPESNSITVEIEGKRVKLYLDKDLNENAEIYYEKAKKPSISLKELEKLTKILREN